MSLPDHLPAPRPLDRSALERVLGRAAELQAQESGTGEGALTEQQLLEIGKEVGLSSQHVRQALAEERTRLALPEESSFVGGIAGPAVATANRTVHGDAAKLMAVLDDWMQRQECLQVKRRFPDRTTWEPKRGFMSDLSRGLNITGRRYALSKATEVAATAIPLDAGRVLIRLDADFSSSRSKRVAGGGATAATGIVGGATPMMLGAFLLPEPTLAFFIVTGLAALGGTAAGIGGGYSIAKSHQQVIARAQLALEQILDSIEHGANVAPSIPSVIGAAAERLLRGTLTDLNIKGTWPRSRP
ncbi:MAG: hypothetical protein H7Z74_07435 [Anaerolineae bacterium]|nr:hypothetical protein [Gemmatimonadaceae bacterium]